MALCTARGQWWRAAMIQGLFPYHDPLVENLDQSARVGSVVHIL